MLQQVVRPIRGIQQFQIRSVANSEKEARETLKQIRLAGYEGIELCSYLISPLPFSIRMLTKLAGMPIGKSGKLDWCALVADSGLKVISIHEDLGSVMKNPESIAQRGKSYLTDIVVITGMRKYNYSDRDEVLSLANHLNQAGDSLKRLGIKLLYHNHNCELQKIDGVYAYDLLIDNTDPDLVNFELDSYWLAEAGRDPLAVMHKLGPRMKLYHINDRGFRCGKASISTLRSDCMELGYGNMSLEPLVQTAKNYGVDAIILETQRNWIHNSPVESLQRSADFMNRYV